MTAIAVLSADSIFWSSVDRWATFAVVVGVVLEGVAEWLPIERREAKFIVALTRFGWLVLVLALAVEIIAQHKKDAADVLMISDLSTAESSRVINIGTERELVIALLPFSGTHIRVASYGDDDSVSYAERLASVLREAKWKVEGPYSGGITIPATIGVQPTVSQQDVQSGHVPAAFESLLSSFWKCGIVPQGGKWMNPEVPPGIIQLRVGPRLPMDKNGHNTCS